MNGTLECAGDARNGTTVFVFAAQGVWLLAGIPRSWYYGLTRWVAAIR